VQQAHLIAVGGMDEWKRLQPGAQKSIKDRRKRVPAGAGQNQSSAGGSGSGSSTFPSTRHPGPRGQTPMSGCCVAAVVLLLLQLSIDGDRAIG